MKIKHYLLVGLCLLSLTVEAQSYLPQPQEAPAGYRLLQCTYAGASLQTCGPVTAASSDWEVQTDRQPVAGSPGAYRYRFTFRAKRPLKEAGVAVAFDRYNWTSDNYVLIPASVYNGNRQRIVNRAYATGLDQTDYYRKELALTSNPIPQLSPEYGAPSRLDVNVSNTATPAIACLERQKKQGTLLFTDQGILRGDEVTDHALIVEESADRSVASFIITAPGVRAMKPEFIGFSPSPDRGLDMLMGEEITICVTSISFACPDIPELLARFHRERKTHTGPNHPRNLMPQSHILSLMARNIDDRYYQNDRWEYYCPENADWISFGWIGGLMNTYPMLALGDAEHLRKVKNTFDFAIPRGQRASGYFMDVLGSDGKQIARDAAALHPEVGLTRKNADILYWMVKQFMLLNDQGRKTEISPEWEASIKRLANAFVSTWQKHRTWGNYLNIETGDVAVYNTTSGAMAVGGLALAAGYYQDPSYLRVALEAAEVYFREFALLGFTSGGCGDILQNADSETAAALMLSLTTLYEVTGQSQWLDRTIDLANLCATWTVSFDYRLPGNTPLARLGAKLTGAVWASTQNKHGAPGFCTASGDPLFKIYRATGDTLYADLMRDILHAHTEGIQPSGQITERLTYCDADSRGSRGDGGKTGWNELNGALMALEIPGIYLRTDLDRLYVFDHLTVCITKSSPNELTLTITNPTPFDADVSLLCENASAAARPLGCNAFLSWPKVKVKAGATIQHRVKRIPGKLEAVSTATD